jgi:hypothetical protein
VNEVVDITKRFRRAPQRRHVGEPAIVLSMADRAPKAHVSVHTPEAIGLDDGRVHLIHRDGDVETRISLRPIDAHAFGRSVLDAAVAVQAREDRGVVLRWESRRRGVDLPEVRPPVACQILDRRGDNVLLSRADTHELSWFDVRSGLPVIGGGKERLRIAARDRHYLQQHKVP